jgi:mannose-6-phosphate isomerase-like protein (cupin superfamily)
MSAGDSLTLPAIHPIRIENPQEERLRMIQIVAGGCGDRR